MSILATELEWPEGTKFFEVQCRLGIWDIDGWDADKAPEVKALGGTVRITPRTPTGRIRILEPDGKYRVVVATPLTFNIDEYTGKLVNTADNTEGVWVVDPTSDTVDPNGFTYSAVVTPKVGSPFTVEFDGSVAINGVYDLANGATVAPSKGVSALDSRIAKLELDVGSLGVIATELERNDGNLSGIVTKLNYLLAGPGRPDTPASTGGVITGIEPVGCEYRSTDGAGVGAWVWMKRSTGWVVVDGDTGWRKITLGARYANGEAVQVRRVGQLVTVAPNAPLNFGTWIIPDGPSANNTDDANLGAGFRPSNSRTAFPIIAVGGTDPINQIIGRVVVLNGAGGLRLAHAMSNTASFTGSYPTLDPWPTILPGTPT